jgi:hypothetical protein
MGVENVAPTEYVQSRIREIRGTKVILDSDLAQLYGVETRALNQAVRRNVDRFPEDFVFQLTLEEQSRLRSQSVISNGGRGGRRYLSYAFTEHGAMMAASVLNSPQAIQTSVFIVRAFIRLRSIYASHIELTRRLDELDTRVSEHDAELRSIIEAIRQLAIPRAPQRHPIGFTPSDAAAEPGVP